jgi:hypothetical protein
MFAVSPVACTRSARCGRDQATLDVRGRKVKLVPTWSGVFGESMAGNVMLPGENARIAPTTFDDWLAAGAR